LKLLVCWSPICVASVTLGISSLFICRLCLILSDCFCWENLTCMVLVFVGWSWYLSCEAKSSAIVSRTCASLKSVVLSVTSSTRAVVLHVMSPILASTPTLLVFQVMYVSWIYNYLCNQCLSPVKLWVWISIRVGCTTLCDKVCQWLVTGRWFSLRPPVSSTNKTDLHDITEILLKVALNTIKQTNMYKF
jgi:hypothetical protein